MTWCQWHQPLPATQGSCSRLQQHSSGTQDARPAPAADCICRHPVLSSPECTCSRHLLASLSRVISCPLHDCGCPRGPSHHVLSNPLCCNYPASSLKALPPILMLCRHPASGYVQGINDLVTPFLAVFLSQHFDGPMEEWRMEQLPEECLLGVEADAYWCLSKLVDSIQDHYINGQPGIQRTVFHLKELVRWAGR